MKWFLSFFLLLIFRFAPAQRLLIHAHNDYQKQEPLVNALRNKVFSIEADIYLVNDTLRVAHDKKESATGPALNALYLQPIVNLFLKYKGRVGVDTGYAPVLMIDIKENGKAVLNKLAKELRMFPVVFDRSANPTAIQIVISGDRGAISSWTSYPSFILFDGRPNEVYDSATLKKVAFISDSWSNYSSPADSADIRLQRLVKKVRGMNKQLRLWATPDNTESWNRLHQLGIDIINTDKLNECSNYFLSKKN